MAAKKSKKSTTPVVEGHCSREGLLKSLDKAFGEALVRQRTKEYDIIPTGCLSLDAATGIGGYPRGRIVEIYGPESSGKTTLMLHAIAQAQSMGGEAAFIDAEHAFDPTYADKIGVDVDNLIMIQPDNGEQGLEAAVMLINSGVVSIVVIDSVAALVPKDEIEGNVGDAGMGKHARLMSQAMRMITGAASKKNVLVVFINQLRSKIGVVYGNPEVTTGGNALKFYASMRLDVRRSTHIKNGDAAVGNDTRVRIVKNKCARPFAATEFQIIWGEGIDSITDLLNVGVANGVLSKAGNWFSYGETRLGNGLLSSRKTLQADPELLGKIDQAIRDDIKFNAS